MKKPHLRYKNEKWKRKLEMGAVPIRPILKKQKNEIVFLFFFHFLSVVEERFLILPLFPSIRLLLIKKR